MRTAVDGMDQRPAILRKDFLLDEYQIFEARVYGADTVLLIVAILDDDTLKRLLACARSLGMEPLVGLGSFVAKPLLLSRLCFVSRLPLPLLQFNHL